MTKLFLSVNFDYIKLAQQIKEELKRNGVEGVIAGEITESPPPEAVRSLILASDGLLAIITSKDYDWIQNEIGIAYAASLPIYAIIKEGIEPSGLLPRISTYIRIDPTWGFDFKKKVAVIASELRKTSTIQVAMDRNQMLAGASGTLQLSIRPRRIPSGEEMITVFVPPEFSVGILQDAYVNYDLYPELVDSPLRKRSTEIPKSACDIAVTTAGQNEAYPRFRKITIILRFPAVERYLNGGWAEFKIDYTAPRTAGKYRFFGSELVSIAGSHPQDATSFEIEPVNVSGEVSSVYLSGIIFTSPHVPLKLPGVVRAVMTKRRDVYTGKEFSGQTVDGICYLASSDDGRYVISGLAPGTYDVYASAIGFSTSVIASGVEIYKQPESLDGYVQLSLSDADVWALQNSKKQATQPERNKNDAEAKS
ncbi:MAG: hypothetical protein ABSC50_07605 [Candidatus Bathyarchaeia archaeon]